MAPARWEKKDKEESSSSSSSDDEGSSPPAAIARRTKFDDEEDDSDVIDSWDAADDSDVEREKAKKAAAAAAKAEADAKANHKSKTKRIEEHIAIKQRRKAAENGDGDGTSDDDDDDDEDEADRRARLRRTEKDADLGHAEDLFGGIGISKERAAGGAVTVSDPNDPTSSIELSALPLFHPLTKDQFVRLRDSLAPLLTANAKKAHYALFLLELFKQTAKELPSEQIKKLASALTTLANEKMKDEKAAEKGGRRTKAAKTKASLAATRDISSKADTTSYADEADDDDFM